MESRRMGRRTFQKYYHTNLRVTTRGITDEDDNNGTKALRGGAATHKADGGGVGGQKRQLVFLLTMFS